MFQFQILPIFRILTLIAIFTIPVVIHSQDAHAQESKGNLVTIPVQDYLQFIKQNEKPRFVSIHGSQLSGQFGQSLKLEIHGQASTFLEKREFLRFDPQNISVDSCRGEAQVDFQGGTASFLPTTNQFSFSCQIGIKNWSQIALTVVQAMGAQVSVKGGEALVQTDAGGDREIILSKAMGSSGPSEDSPLSAVGRFRLTLLPEGNKFDYQMAIENPSRSPRKYTITWANSEHPSRITTDVEFSEEAGKLHLRLKPGNNIIRATGSYTADQFIAPLEGGPHYLLIENHQLLQVSTTSSARKISARDSGMSSNFSGQRAFLLQKTAEQDRVSWQTKKLEILAALGFSIDSADYNYFVPAHGHGIVEARYVINNQGQPEIPLPVAGRPLYLEIDGTPQVLATNAEKDLLLQISPGIRNVYLQYEAPVETAGLFGVPSLLLAKPNAVMSQISSRVTFEDGASILAARGLNRFQTDFVNWFAWLRFLIVGGLLLGYFVRHGQLSIARSLLALGAGVLAAGAWALAPSVLLLATVLVLIRYRKELLARLLGIQWSFLKVIAAIIVGGIGVFALSILILASRLDLGKGDEVASYSEGDSARYTAPMAKKGAAADSMLSAQSFGGKRSQLAGKSPGGGGGAFGEPLPPPPVAPLDEMNPELSDQTMTESAQMEGESLGQDYQGLPAKVTVPPGKRVIHFERGLVEASAPIAITAAFIHPGVSQVFLVLAGLGWLAYAWFRRKDLLGWLRL